MKDFFRENKLVLILFLLLLAVGGTILLSYSKTQIHLSVNQWHGPVRDFFFKYATWMGNGWFVAVLFIVFLFVKVRYAWMLLAGNILITIVIQGLKHLAFPDTPRPAAYFAKLHESLYLIPGEHMNMYNSFPSGHSATAFGLFILLLFITRNHGLKFIWLIMATLIA
ncbi:MAG: phosphatase PAP2 family protein, partial [Bacteroidales bacterium]|nr:phosphatase PAP2 family protein [Bacteroidales bacterium]